ncbi:MAG TPA: lactate racemase domain-containing protein [Gemmataceae bacterium]
MQVPIEFGREHLTLEIRPDRLVRLERADCPPPLADPVAAVRDALESPLHYPPLRQALTPDDHVTVVVDEHLPRLPELVTAVLEHIVAAGVDPASVTLLCPPTASKQPWIEDLPDAFQDVHLEVHDPADRKRLAYLASTKAGRRVYLNRSAVDADQLVLLTGPHFDPLHGYAGAEGALYPALSDAEARARWDGSVTMDSPAEHAWPVRKEAGEVSWLLGAPFYVQVIEGAGDAVVQVLGGPADTAAEGRRWLNRCWRATAAEPADLVMATISGDPARQDFADMAGALAAAVRVVRPDGVIALLCAAAPELGDGFRQMLKADEPIDATRALREVPPPDWPAAFQWLEAVRKAHVYLLSGLPAEMAEGLFTTPIDHARQVQRLIDAGGTCLVLADAHKLMAVTQ